MSISPDPAQPKALSARAIRLRLLGAAVAVGAGVAAIVVAVMLVRGVLG
jgi:hypothetical protein